MNVIWILVDSIRNYSGAGDDRDKMEFMNEFAEEAVEFETVVTSAPSSVMSVSAMMTAWPAYFIGRNYDDFKYSEHALTSLAQLLRSHGYHDYGIIFFREGREKLGNVIRHVERKHWPTGLSHAPRYWENDSLNQILANLLPAGVKKPTFLYIHYDCRLDLNVSAKVRWGVEQIRAAGLWDDSIIVLCSDHGYPDPSRGLTPEALKRQKLSHDLLLTDDNILIPLYLRYPGCVPKRISETVSTLDIFPTILDILGIPTPVSPYGEIRGKSLLPLINGSNADWVGADRKIRCDNRLLAQTGRATAIRGKRYKYIIHHETGLEEFYDLEKDPMEQQNLVRHKEIPVHREVLEEYRGEFNRQEADALELQFRFTLSQFQDEIKRKMGDEIRARKWEILVLGFCTAGYLQILLRTLQATFGSVNIDLLTDEKIRFDSKAFSLRKVEVTGNLSTATEDGPREDSKLLSTRHDLVIVPVNAPSSLEQRQIMRLAKSAKASHILSVDYNLRPYYKDTRTWVFPLRVLWSKRRFYKEEPSLLFLELRNYLKTLLKSYFNC